MNSYHAIICILAPFIGVLVTPFLARVNGRIRDFGAVFFSFVAAYAAIRLLPGLFQPNKLPIELTVNWLTDPVNINTGILIDPLSIILCNVVAVISFVIMVYCLGYMKGDPAITRFWMWMNAFIGSMLLLVLSNNLLFVFVGWKLVGLCSYGLIGFYYKDEKQYWIGGPAPTRFVTPSQAGLKALVVTGIGDLLMLGGILIIYFFSGTINLLALYRSAPDWLPQIARTPGLVILVSILILAGPIGKSAQFPLHEWLPEAMAGPGPVSALIHAATMVKSGIYLIARFIPIFYYGYWVTGCTEAATFFYITAWVGVITAFLAATQGMVSLELKKVLAYSTVSQIGYMMLGLGISGFQQDILLDGYTSGIFHLVSHALFKACLFLCAGTVIHAAHSIYMHEMGAMRKTMRFTWIFMTVAALSLIGLPPLPGFWSKDAVLLATLKGNSFLFALAAVTVILTAFYTVRFIGMVFFGPESDHLKQQTDGHSREGAPVMWIACGVLAVIIVVMGLAGLSVEHIIKNGFDINLVGKLHLPVVQEAPESSNGLVPILSIICLVVGALPAFYLYIIGKGDPAGMLDRSAVLRICHRFFWNRWYIDGFYNRVVLNGFLALAGLVAKLETGIDTVFHKFLPNLVTAYSYRGIRLFRTDSRELAVNILYVMILFIILTGLSLFVW